MANSEGKRFEQNFASSCKAQGLWYLKIRDTFVLDQKMGQSTNINPYDFLVHSDENLWAIECKSTLGKSISVQLTPDEPQAQIKAHQIKGLMDFSQFQNHGAGFFIQWRDFEEVYFVPIQSFLDKIAETEKKSLSYKDCQECGNLVETKKLRTNIAINVKKMLQ